MRKVHDLRARGITILFVSHATGDIKALGDRAIWLDHGNVRAIGKADLIVMQYLAAMVEKDAKYLAHDAMVHPQHSYNAPDEIEYTIPNIDHRFGDARAEILGIAVHDSAGVRLHSLQPDTTIIVRISFRAKTNLDHPIAGFMFRNHLGVDFAGTNTAREGYQLPPMASGDLCTVDFHLDLPALYPSSFSFSPAIANGSLEHYAICDWIDNAVALHMDPSEGPIYGQFHFPCRVEVNVKLPSVGVPSL